MCVGILKILSNVRDFIVVTKTKTIVFEFLLFINKTSCKHIAEEDLVPQTVRSCVWQFILKKPRLKIKSNLFYLLKLQEQYRGNPFMGKQI